MKQVHVILLLVLCTAIAAVAAESETKPALPDLKDVVVAGPYCGIYALYACLDVFGKQPPIEELLKTEYLGSIHGSTAKELIAAAKKYGIHGISYGNMTWRQLLDAKEPMILHFRGGSNGDFNHWVAFLGAEGRHFRIIDLPHELTYLSTAELLAHWDGTAIVLSKNPIQNNLVWRARLDYLPLILCLLESVWMVRIFLPTNIIEPSSAPTHRLMVKRLFVQIISLFGIIGFIAVIVHSISETGLLKNPVAVAEVTRRYYAVDVPLISLKEMKTLVEQDRSFIIDTRYKRDFEHGAIPHAENLPIDSDLAERKKVLRGIDKSTKIILYCQSSRCGFSDEIASFLKFNGYRNISIFRGGFREWTAKN